MRHRDDGTILLLTIGYAIIALALVLGLTDVSVLLLDRRNLQSVADGAALSIAQDVSVDGLYGRRDGDGLGLADRSTLQADAERYVARSDLPDAETVVVPIGSDTVQVLVRRSARLPFAALLDALGIGGTQQVEASAHARLRCLGC
ncbi:MAG: pilus assembly protein TadG-related protein [Frankiaceae bacterium]